MAQIHGKLRFLPRRNTPDPGNSETNPCGTRIAHFSDDPNFVADPFNIEIYDSDDGVTPTGSALQYFYVGNSADLTAGLHSVSVYPPSSVPWESHYLMAVVDSGDVM